ncbi:hypothetical protein IJT93_01055 [bacterium]|nr:hypothetical protein [bacterium]
MRIPKFCAVLAMGLALSAAGAVPAQAKLFGEENLKADFDGDGRTETVRLMPNAQNDGLRAALYDSAGNMLWISEKNDFNRYASCFIADIDCDSVPELIFSGRDDGYLDRENTTVYHYEAGKFNEPADYGIYRSSEDTTKYRWVNSKNGPYSRTDIATLTWNDHSSQHVRIYNLRQVGTEIWGDIWCGMRDSNNHQDVIIGKSRLVPSMERGVCILQAVESRGCCDAAKRLMAFPNPVNSKIKADLTGNGKLEAVSFNSYYPGTGYNQFYQIIVADEAGNTLWKSNRQNKNPKRLFWNEDADLSPSEGGLSIYFDNGKDSVASGFVSDIDGDGCQELVVSTWKGGDRTEIWRWRNGAFHYVCNVRLMRSAEDANTYLYVDPKDVDGDKRIYGKLRYDMASDTSTTERIAVSNLRVRNGEIWGITGGSGSGGKNTAVKLKPFKGGFKAVETVPYKGYRW